ncbi:hypothetical protein, partial [Stenotrophomonas maltophilia]|uniref:hypothetical protein n=1 Tax=Stenotrophomonas maltophilia TaxID=40324 RepID=UPI00195471A3
MGINYGGTSRRIAVPDKLAFPSLNSVGELALLDVAIAEVAAQANVTQWRDIRGAHDSRAWPA